MAVAYVQNRHFFGATSANTVTSTFNSTTTAGNLLIAAIVMNSAADPVTSITGGGTWAQAYVQTFTGGSIEVWYCANCTAITDVVINFSGTGESSVNTYEYSGLLTISPLDKTVSNSGSSSSASSGTTATISQANELIFVTSGLPSGAVTDYGTYNGNPQANAWNNFRVDTSDGIVSSATTYSNTYTLNQSKDWAMGIATFKAAITPVAPSNKPILQAINRARTY